MDIVEKTSGPGVYLFAVGAFGLHPDLLPSVVTGCSYFHGTIGLLPIPLYLPGLRQKNMSQFLK
jgi:hypothetical protein